MELINIKSEAIIALTGSGRKVEMLSVKRGTVYFSRSFCVANKIKAGQFMHFINDDSDWKFFVNNDKDGFPLINDTKKNGALVIFNSALTHLIRRSTKKIGAVSFPIEGTVLEQGGKKIFMIMTHKPIMK